MAGLEEAIKQKGFTSEFQKLVLNLIYTNNWLRDQRNIVFKRFKVTDQQYNVLRILRGNHPNPYSTSEIRERMLDKMSDTSRIVDRLVAKGYVVKKTCPTNKRLVDVVISQKGLDLLKNMDSKVDKHLNSLNNLSNQEAQVLNFLLDKIRN